MTYETADDDLAVASLRDGRSNSCGNLRALGSSGLLGDTTSRSGGGRGSLDSGSATWATTAAGAGALGGILHDLVERLVELSLSRHGDGVVCW